MDKPLLAERDRIAAEVSLIRTGAAELSQLLSMPLKKVAPGTCMSI